MINLSVWMRDVAELSCFWNVLIIKWVWAASVLFAGLVWEFRCVWWCVMLHFKGCLAQKLSSDWLYESNQWLWNVMCKCDRVTVTGWVRASGYILHKRKILIFQPTLKTRHKLGIMCWSCAVLLLVYFCSPVKGLET